MKSDLHKSFFCFVFISLSDLIASCAYYNEKNPPDPSTISAQQTITWQRVSTEFFQPRCAVCHGQGGANVNVSDYNSVIQQLNRIQEEITKNKMPPDSPLTAYEQKLFSVWIQQGSPNEAPGGSK